ncbi:MAG: PH domain-containing protein [Acidobacteriota bacterium]
MPSEVRLHPSSLVFGFADELRRFALPALVAFVSGRAGGGSEDLWLLVLLVPSLGIAVIRYLTLRLRYDDDQLVIRSGLIFRNERHVPYSRVQNVDAIQNLVHRLFDVAEVRIDTGVGGGSEARLKVLPLAAVDDMRARVAQGRGAAAPTRAEPAGAAEATPAVRTLLRLGPRDLLRHGFIENQGVWIIGAAFGAAWELGLLNRLDNVVLGRELFERASMREVVGPVVSGRVPPLEPLAVLAGVVIGFLILVRLLSMAWSLVRLYDYRLTHTGTELVASFGLFTRVTATVPIHRVQLLTISESLLHRLTGHAAVDIDTAGGVAERAGTGRESLAPILPAAEVPALVGALLPGFEAAALDWQPVHPRAFRRAVKVPVALGLAAGAATAPVIGWGAIAAAIVLAGWGAIVAHRYVAHLAWCAPEGLVLFRSGWLARKTTIAPIAKIQVVRRRESPFDRRHGTASVRVDTAGASEFGHRVDIPYLPAAIAVRLEGTLASGAAATVFRW